MSEYEPNAAPDPSRASALGIPPVMEDGHLTRRSVIAITDEEWSGFNVSAILTVRWHMQECERCAREVRAFQALTGTAAELLEALDTDVPSVTAASVIAHARRATPRPALRFAVGVVGFGAAAIAAAALPSAPLHEPFRNVLARIAHVGAASSRAVLPNTRIETATPTSVTVTPEHGLVVAFQSAQPSASVDVQFTNDVTATLATTDTTVAYRVGVDRIDVLNARARGSYQLGVPRALGATTISVAGQTVFRQRPPGDVTPPAAAATASRSSTAPVEYHISLSSPRP